MRGKAFIRKVKTEDQSEVYSVAMHLAILELKNESAFCLVREGDEDNVLAIQEKEEDLFTLRDAINLRINNTSNSSEIPKS